MTAALPPIQLCSDLPAVRALLAAAGLPTAEFAALCPASAVCLMKALDAREAPPA